MSSAFAIAGGGFAPLDWGVVVAYLGIVIAVGAVAGRRASGGGDEFFLAGRSMPVWAVALSVLATSLSAATFVGGPQQAYDGDLTYLSTNLGSWIAVAVVAMVFVPAFYRAGVTSVYGLLGRELGPRARVAAGVAFLGGRVFASGARLFIVAIPFSLVAFGDVTEARLVASIVCIAAAAAAYTAFGGIRAVIWTDVLQAVIVIGTVGVALVLLLGKIPLEAGEIVERLRSAEVDKLRWLDTSLDLTAPFTLWTACIGFALFNVAAFGTDQDLTQRLLTCRSAREGGWSVVLASVLSVPVVALFLTIGLLLWVYYGGDGGGGGGGGMGPEDSRRVFLHFLLTELPAGLRGLIVAGLFAAAMSSLDSALNAMASTTVADFVRPRRAARSRGRAGDAVELRVSRAAVVGWAVALAGFASVCVFWQASSGETLIQFALGVMVFAYGGLLGVFLTVLLTRRGSESSATWALVVGALVVLMLQDPVFGWWTGAPGRAPAFPWRMTAAVAASFAVACSGARGRGAPAPDE